ncbi:MAG: hypothetical protein WCY87_02015 [Candidatus Cloacimonadales bacterium]|nr:hypothetical protein [Candidatus Cloacimonadota bacterium]MDY0381612.1 hypothetical protein [Candidatus Cloacimonadaceae bacterium]HCM15273.1 hypothetical protein [Candidatus Cloacimonas sp.]MCB5257501.1 hypothetical protein [Candidatus Cloacimonadota bacterium]MCB5263190.1 hypothetical protein [Candidatus Cloacimonadota bacterium]
MKPDKRYLAAVSAVLALISAEETAVGYSRPLSGNPSHPWPAYARAQTMQYRDITQRRIIKRSR